MTEPILAIDFGTSTSSAALVTEDGVELVKERSTGLWQWPSTVCLDGETLLVGTPAERHKRIRPGCYRAEFKRELGQPAPLILGERSFQAGELVAATLAVLKESAERRLGAPITRALLTIPAAYGTSDPRREQMISAGEQAGFEVVELLYEPVAAALAPVEGHRFGPGDVVLVYDFGGGTFDTALVRVGEDGGHEVLGHSALDDCGGRDIDALVFRELLGAGGERLAEVMDASAATAWRNRLRFGDLVRQFKHHLTDVARAEDIFDPADLLLELDRERLALLAEPQLRRTIGCCAELVGDAGIEPGQVTAILVTGGSSRMPVVADALRRAFDAPLHFVTDPDLAVVQGAAVWARRTDRVLDPWPLADGEVPLRWRVPGSSFVLLHWHVVVGEPFDKGDPLASVRLDDGTVWELRAAAPGALTTVFAGRGERIPADAVLALSGRATGEVRAARPSPSPIAEQDAQPFGSTAYGGQQSGGPADRAADPAPPTLPPAAPRPAAGRSRPEERRPPAARSAASAGSDRWEGVLRIHHGERLRGLAVSADGGRLATVGDEQVHVWDTADGTLLCRLDGGASGVAFLGGDLLATCGEGIQIWDVDGGRRLVTLEGDDMSVTRLAYHPGRKGRIAAAYEDGSVDVFGQYGTRSGAASFVKDLIEEGAGDPAGVTRPVPPARFRHEGGVTCLVFSQDGKRLATGGPDGHARVWNAADGTQRVRVQHPGAVNAVALSPAGRWLATGGEDAYARILDVDSTRQESRLPCLGPVRGIAFSPSGRFLAVADQEASVLIWEHARDIRRPLAMPGPSGHVAFADNGRVLVGGTGADVVLWPGPWK